jgi:folate-binding protein YgfZ
MDDIAPYPAEQIRLPLHKHYERSDVPLSERDGWLLPKRFHAISDEVSLLEHGSASVDFSDHGLLRLEGKDAVDFLNRISTNDFRSFSPGDSLQTVLATEKGKVVDSIIAVHRDDHLLLIVSRGAQSTVKQWMEKFIIAEDISVVDQTGKYLLFAVFHLGDVVENPIENNAGYVFHSKYYDHDAVFYIFDAMSVLPDSVRLLTENQVGNDAFEVYNIRQGIPQCQHEIMRECNPLELNLWNQISFTKGCYIGQEVIARLDTYKKIQRTLCKFRSDSPVVPGSECRIVHGGKDIGIVTSCARDDDNKGSFVGLGVIRKEFALQGGEYSMADGAVPIVVEHVFEHDEIVDGNNNSNR